MKQYPKDLKEFARRAGRDIDELREELEIIKEEYRARTRKVPESVLDAQALAHLKARCALNRHIQNLKRREKYKKRFSL